MLPSVSSAMLAITLALLTAIEPAAQAQSSDAGDAGGTFHTIRKLIEFGWDEPDTAFLRKHQRQIERTPFDGCVFHVNAAVAGMPPENFTWLCWGTRRFREEELAAALADLRAISWERFTENFLRFNVTPGKLDWFDDHGAVLANARLAARLAREGHCRGILLDTEQYESEIFRFSKQRDAASKPWDAYREQVRLRGREFIEALQDEYPGLTLMVTFGPSLVWTQSNGGRKALSECEYGLLVPFFDGLIDGLRAPSRLVDGHEMSYGYREHSRFKQAREVMTARAAELMAMPAAYRRALSPGFGLWLDYDWKKHGWKTDDLEANYFSPSRFEAALRAALEQTTEYVWIYSETPRWWTSEGASKLLPEPYDRAIRAARKGFCRD